MTDRNGQGESQPPDAAGNATAPPAGKKKFVEPEISQPVNVLEATTYFQAVDSGATGLRDPEGRNEPTR